MGVGITQVRRVARARCAPIRLRTAASMYKFQPFDPGRLNLQGDLQPD